jgi:hypothetical protein
MMPTERYGRVVDSIKIRSGHPSNSESSTYRRICSWLSVSQAKPLPRFTASLCRHPGVDCLMHGPLAARHCYIDPRAVGVEGLMVTRCAEWLAVLWDLLASAGEGCRLALLLP